MTTWNPADKSASITLSGGNLTAAGTATAGGVRGATSQASGQKLYWEVTVGGTTPGATSRVGFAVAAQGLTTTLGSVPQGCGWNGNVGTVVIAGGAVGTAVTYATGDVLRFALDLVNNKIWVAKNGGLWNNSGAANPATNTGGFALTSLSAGPYFICWINNSTNGSTFTMDPTGAAFGPPSGFSTWDTGSPPPAANANNLPLLGVG